MSRREKLLAKIRNNPRSVRFDELVRVLEWHSFELRKSKGSHHMYVRGSHRITVVWRRPHVHPNAVREVLRIIDEMVEEE